MGGCAECAQLSQYRDTATSEREEKEREAGGAGARWQCYRGTRREVLTTPVLAMRSISALVAPYARSVPGTAYHIRRLSTRHRIPRA
eukprot:2968077-Rhodomonas_salina.2